MLSLGKGVGDHLMCAQRDEFDKPILDKFLSVTNFLVYGAVARRSAHELYHDLVVNEWCIALVIREFVSGLPSYRFIHKRVRDRKPSLRESSWLVCGFRTAFFIFVYGAVARRSAHELSHEKVVTEWCIAYEV